MAQSIGVIFDFSINGKLIADSNDPNKRINFTGVGQDPGAWNGIKINSGGSSNLIAYGSGNGKCRNLITSNHNHGISAVASTPIFGLDVTNQWGNNEIHDNDGYQALQSSGNQLKAERCYWAGQHLDISGNVDNVPYLSSAPNPVGWGPK